jgi:hypothetical protein
MARTITTELFKFEELSPEAKAKAIENYREQLEEGKHGASDFPNWAIDDCSLLEPKHVDMVELFGEDYYFENKEQFVFKNNRKGITFNCDHPYRHLSFHNALEVTNDRMFLLFLGIPEKFHGCINYEFYDDDHRYPDSKIEIGIWKPEDLNSTELTELQNLIDVATTRFDTHRNNILERIENDIEYRYSDESIEEELENDDSIEFTADGEIWEE